MDVKRIKDIANSINEISDFYQLTHAVHACEEYLEMEIREEIRKLDNDIRNVLPDELRETLKNYKGEKRDEKLNEIRKNSESKKDELKKLKNYTIHIHIKYAKIDVDSSRVIPSVNGLMTIILPIELKQELENSRDDDNKFKEVFWKLREAMAHEIGHIALHHKQLIAFAEMGAVLSEKHSKQKQIINLYGSRLLDESYEEESNLFEKEILRLREERNDETRRTGLYNKATPVLI